MKTAGGSYVGNGTTRDVTGLGAAADFVLVRQRGSIITQLWTSTLGAASRKPLTGATIPTTTNSITQHASGFTVGSDTTINNATGTPTYDWFAVSDNGVADFQVGTYVGDGNDSRNLDVLDFQPDIVIIYQGAATANRAALLKLSSMAGDLGGSFSAQPTTNVIQAIRPTGFQVGSDAQVNAATETPTYHYACFKAVSGLCYVGSYAGDGTTDNLSHSGFGLSPTGLALVKSGAAVVATLRYKAQTGDASSDADGTATGTDRIQAIEADGFQTGLSTRVNVNATTFYFAGFAEGESSVGAAAALAPTMGLLGVG